MNFLQLVAFRCIADTFIHWHGNTNRRALLQTLLVPSARPLTADSANCSSPLATKLIIENFLLWYPFGGPGN